MSILDIYDPLKIAILNSDNKNDTKKEDNDKNEESNLFVIRTVDGSGWPIGDNMNDKTDNKGSIRSTGSFVTKSVDEIRSAIKNGKLPILYISAYGTTYVLPFISMDSNFEYFSFGSPFAVLLRSPNKYVIGYIKCHINIESDKIIYDAFLAL